MVGESTTARSDDATEGADAIRASLGAQIREVREARGLTLKALADSVGVTPSLLSQVENDKAQPSLGTLRRVAAHLHLSADALLGLGEFARTPLRPAVQRRSESPAITIAGGARWERLGGSIDHVLEIVRMTYPPGASSTAPGERLRFLGYEFGVLLTGELTVHLGFEALTLSAGDSVQFDASEPHAYENRTDADAEGIWFVVRDAAMHARIVAGLTSAHPNPGTVPGVSAVLGALQREGW